jgi:hypothetical protein
MKSNKSNAWRERNPEKYLECQRLLMRRRRAAARDRRENPPCSSFPITAPRVSEPAPVSESEAVPVVVVPVPAAVAEVVPVPVVAETAAAKMERLLAAGRASVGAAPAEAVPEPNADPSPYPVPPAIFQRASPDFRRSWVRKNWPDLCRLEPEEADAAIQERLAEIRARK